MAAYAALVSLMTTLNNIQLHPRVSTFFHHHQIQSLHDIINSLLHFVENSNSHGGGSSEESRIASTAHASEDVIESHVVDQIHARSSEVLDLETQIEDMNAVKETVMVTEFQGKMEIKDEQSASPSISIAPFTTKKNLVVGFDEKLIQVMDRLTGHQLDLQIFPIVGMGGIGKTTLAKSVYDHLLIVESFDIRAWVTVSQEYSVDNVLSELLSCLGKGSSETDQLGQNLYQTLWGRRYLIVLDDIWSVEAWDKIKCFFPNNDQRSRVVITSRISSVATHLSSSSFEMNFLDEDQSWELFCGNVFLDKSCPPKLEEIGKKIVGECNGLPLAIVVIGGLLRNSRSTLECWENVARDLNSILISESDSHCLNILSLSYNHLPAHLKSCFLYMGIFKEDKKIRVTRLIDLFVAEGFLKPKEGQTLEDIAENYLNDLVDRNLILVDSWRWNGRIKYCKMHDLVREVCLMIGESAKIFLGMGGLEIPPDINRVRRIIFYGSVPVKKKWHESFFNHLPSASLVRTFLCEAGHHFYEDGPLPFKSRLLRVLDGPKFDAPEDISQHVNLRYLHREYKLGRFPFFKLPSPVSLLWNVHTLIFNSYMIIEAPLEIWYMRQLRHLRSNRVILPDPPPSEKVEQHEDALLPNLQTLSSVENFSFTEEVCKKIPNIKKLGIFYWTDSDVGECPKVYQYNLGNLYKLQTLSCTLTLQEGEFLKSVVLPSSLRKLSLYGCSLRWEDVNTIGLSLPHLQVLILYSYAVVGSEWDCVEEAFPCLKSLEMDGLPLTKWTAESSDCFPVLEKLNLHYFDNLERIPSGIGETLRSLLVCESSVSAAISSIEILEEQLSIGNEDFQLKLVLRDSPWEEKTFIRFMKNVDVKSFTSNNLEFSSASGATLDELLSRDIDKIKSEVHHLEDIEEGDEEHIVAKMVEGDDVM